MASNLLGSQIDTALALFRLLPSGSWSVDNLGHIIDPAGTPCQFSGLDPVRQHLYAELFVRLVQITPEIVALLRKSEAHNSVIRKELTYRANTEHGAYEMAVVAALDVLFTHEAYTPSALQALLEAAERIKVLKHPYTVAHQNLSPPSVREKQRTAGLDNEQPKG